VKVLEKINKVFSIILKVIMVLLFAWMIIAVTMQVFGRYIFNTGFPWTEETARYCMIWLVFLGAAYITINNDNIKVTAIEDLFKGVSKRIINIIQDIAALIFVSTILYYSFGAIKITMMSVSANTGLNMGIIYLVFPIAAILLIYGYVYRLIKNILLIKNASEKEEGGKQI